MCIYKAVTILTKTQREGGGKCLFFLAVWCPCSLLLQAAKVNVSRLKPTWSLQLYRRKSHPLCEAPLSQYKNH